ncbi:hypothetical protein BDV98DRAFT_177444 [Pterulicium gracile]|uniref:Uncharacterized protein n=1 Tax=Pterulicium gracile TaxID=1884261 RepID=A0A5C3QFS2_9AGAR|nr:hypothetical protein BDV98DRAFT_177444 [Pterula gracilis]
MIYISSIRRELPYCLAQTISSKTNSFQRFSGAVFLAPPTTSFPPPGLTWICNCLLAMSYPMLYIARSPSSMYMYLLSFFLLSRSLEDFSHSYSASYLSVVSCSLTISRGFYTLPFFRTPPHHFTLFVSWFYACIIAFTIHCCLLLHHHHHSCFVSGTLLTIAEALYLPSPRCPKSPV